MRKNNTDFNNSLIEPGKNKVSLCTPGFLRMCTGSFLTMMSVYMLVPFLPLLIDNQTGASVSVAASATAALLICMFLVGPLHAYLGDAFKRKSVWLYAVLGMLLSSACFTLAQTTTEWLALLCIYGACFGLYMTAGITVTIDITPSARRSHGNMVYALVSRLGMLAGVGAGLYISHAYTLHYLVYASIVCGILGLLLGLRVHVAFRAPIGVSRFNLDRFLLPRAWVPALNLLSLAFGVGLLIPMLWAHCYWALIGLALLAVLIVPFTKMFVKLSHHCQRGTANTTCHLAVETGLWTGIGVAACMSLDATAISEFAGGMTLFSLAFYLLFTRPYYRKMRVR